MEKGIKIVFLLIVFLIIHPVFSQGEVNQLNKNGEREGVWEKYYDNNRLRYRGTFKNGREVGTFKYYSAASSDHPVIIKEFDANSDLADVKFYTEAGVLESEGQMKGKDRVGKWIFYHTDGKSVMSEENYVNGKLDGTYKTYFQDGSPTEIANYKNGLLDGNYKKYA
ncbi:MAG: toxin-antitoxin system YwqK family antitoxin, partial [Lutimonas sp.]